MRTCTPKMPPATGSTRARMAGACIVDTYCFMGVFVCVWGGGGRCVCIFCVSGNGDKPRTIHMLAIQIHRHRAAKRGRSLTKRLKHQHPHTHTSNTHTHTHTRSHTNTHTPAPCRRNRGFRGSTRTRTRRPKRPTRPGRPMTQAGLFFWGGVWYVFVYISVSKGRKGHERGAVFFLWWGVKRGG
jgi:hypothetical protein